VLARTRIRRTALAALLAVSLVALVASCQRMAEEAVEQQTGVEIDREGDSVTITGSEGEQIKTQTESLPENWPADVPVYEGAEIQASTSVSVGEGTQLSATLVTDDPVAEVFAWYKAEAASGGWTVESEASMQTDGAATAFLALKKGSVEVKVTVNEADDGSSNIVTVVSIP